MIPETPTLQRKVSQGEERYTNLIKNEFIKHAKEINRLHKTLEEVKTSIPESDMSGYYTKQQTEDKINEIVEQQMSYIDNQTSVPTKVSDLLNDMGYLTYVTWDSVEDKPDKFPPTTHTHTWNSIQNKPNTFPPSFHEHQDYLTEVLWGDIQNKPSTYPPSQHLHPQYLESVSWGDILSKPTFATVATSGSYTDLSNKPTIPTVPTNVSAFTNDSGYITGVAWEDVTSKPSFATVATSGNYNDLSNKPTIPAIPTNISSFTNDVGYITGVAWGDITNKPTTFTPSVHYHDERYPLLSYDNATQIASNTDFNDFTTAGTYYTTGGNSGSSVHTSMSHSPTNGTGGGFMLFVIGAAGYPHQIVCMYNGDIYERWRGSNEVWGEWHKRAYTDSDITGNAETATTANTVARTNATTNAARNVWFSHATTPERLCYDDDFKYNPSTNTLTVGSITGSAGSVAWGNVTGKPTFATVATSGSYADLSNKPTIPTVPTNVSAFTNDSGYITSAALSGYALSNHTHSGYASSSHTHNYAGSSSAGGAATSVAIEAGTTDADRYVWFSYAGSGNEGKACYDAQFKYNPSTDNLTVSNINGVAVGSSPKFTDTVYTHPTTAGNKHIPSGGSSGQILKYSASGTAVWADEYSYTHPTTAGNKHIPSGGSSGNVLVYSSAGTAAWGAVPSHSHSNFVKSGSTAAAGYVPAPSTTAGTTKYLCEDGTWKVPPNDNTDTQVTSTAVSPSSATSYYLTGSSSSSTATGGLSKNGTVRMYLRAGTASTEGLSRLYLGNTTAKGTDGNQTGAILLYGNSGKYAIIYPHGDDTTDRAIYTPKAGGTLVVHSTDTAIGSASKPVYVTADGVATVCTSIDSSLYSNNAVTSTSVTFPSSSTNYYLLASSSEATNTAGISKFGTNARLQISAGTASAEGKSVVILGNSTATGTAGNVTGGLCLYGTGGKYSTIYPHIGDTTSRTLYTPKSGGTLVAHTTDTAIGSASVPVYVTANGVATACTSLDATKLSGTIPSGCYTNTTYTAGTAAELTTGTATGTRVWSPKILADYVKGSSTQAETGTLTMLNGLILKWGKQAVSGGSVTITFGAAFPTACYMANVTRYYSGATNGGVDTAPAITALSKTAITVSTYNRSTEYLMWMAIGK